VSDVQKEEKPLWVLCQGEQFLWNPVRINFTRSVSVSESPSDPLPHNVTMTTLSISPRVFYIEEFLTDEECKLIIDEVEPKMERSKVGGSYENAKLSEVRTSSQAWINVENLTDSPLFLIRRRVEILTRIPSFLAEYMQVVHYDVGQFYLFHHDPSSKLEQPTNPYYQGGGNRLATILFYLSDVGPGCSGDTVFPLDHQTDGNCCDATACPRALRVAPKKRSAILWYNLREEGHINGDVVDYSTLHAGCPVHCGEKWAANYWLRNKRVDGKLYSHLW